MKIFLLALISLCIVALAHWWRPIAQRPTTTITNRPGLYFVSGSNGASVIEVDSLIITDATGHDAEGRTVVIYGVGLDSKTNLFITRKFTISNVKEQARALE